MFLRTLAILLVLSASTALSIDRTTSAQKIGWPDLVPKMKPLVDPLDSLTFERRFEVESIFWVRQLSEEERSRSPYLVEEANGYEKELGAAGISVNDLIAEYEAFAVAVDEQGKSLRKGLDGEAITLEGFLLPLEFSTDGSKEFLLVPYVGACIHVPPPPANQIVLISLTSNVLIREIFAPARVTGRIRTRLSTTKLFFVDGEADIQLGYHIRNAQVELLQ